MESVKDTTGLWIYRSAFLLLAGLCVAMLNVVLQVRLTWYPSYEEKLLLRMKQIQDSVQPPQRPHPKGKPRHHHGSTRVRS